MAELVCGVGLHAAASTSDRIAFHTLNRATGHRVRRELVDQETGDPVAAEDQVKGYATGQDDYVVLQPDELAAAVPESNKTLAVEAFIACDEIDAVFFDRPYYLSPSDRAAVELFALIRDGLRLRKVAALARAVLFRRVRTLLIRAHGDGMIGHTLSFDYEARSASDAFSEIPEIEIKGEMLDLAKHIIATKRGRFDPARFEDRYESALAELVRARAEGRPLPAAPPPEPDKVVDLLQALRLSAKAAQATGTVDPERAVGRDDGRRTQAAPSRRRRQRKAG